MTRFRPTDTNELVEIVAAAVAREEPLEITAGGTKRGFGRPLQLPHVVDASAFSGVRSYEPEELVITAGAATPMVEIDRALATGNQMLAFEPPDWRPLFGTTAAEGTLGGLIACNLAGPRRIKQGAARDHFLGFAAVSGRGEAFKAGGKVVKNVTGYDLCKLVAGSHGTLAVLTEVTMKVLPRPEQARSLAISGLDGEAATRAMTAALNSAHEVSGAAHLPAGESGRDKALTLLRLEGPGPSVAARATALKSELASFGRIDERGGEDSARLWRAVRDVAPFAPSSDRALWRVSVPPASGAGVAAAVTRQLDADHLLDWGGGLVWLAIKGGDDGGAAVIRRAVAACGGHATLIRAPDAMRALVPVFEPQAPALAALSARVKESFDPRRILNRGRMYSDL
ncbi:MAG TPA: glycolate oxidase subunit GlcE [Stellaceae bacterium]|nr:glycolate oxidase subunit GlcE [Stellaceae bacterium]